MKKKTIVSLLKQWGEVTPDKNAYIFLNDNGENCYLTYKEVYEGACRYSGYLQSKGIVKGDRVIVLGEQSIDNIYSIYGILMTGAVFVLIPSPIDQGKYERLQYTIKSSQAKCIICSKEEIKFIKEDINIPIINTKYITKTCIYKKENINEEDIACLQYTSGSISEPKGIVWTHRNIIESLNTLSKYTFRDDTFVTWLPFFHSMGLLTGVFLNVYVNNTNVILKTKRFIKNPVEWIEKICEYKSSMVWAPNSAYLTCVDLLKKNKDIEIDLSYVKNMINCSESIQAKDWKKIFDGLSKYGLNKDALCAVYGLSESTGEVSGGKVYNLKVDSVKLQENRIVPATDYSSRTRVLSGVGSIIDCVNVVIVNPETLEECKCDEIGEIWVQGNKVAYGYWNNSKVTEETFKAELNGYKGTFLRTGDLGCVFKNQLYILGRMKEMFIINGHNIFPRDIENNIRNNIEKLIDKIVYSFALNIGNRDRIVIGIEGEFKKEDYDTIAKAVKKVVYKYFEIEPYDIFIVEDRGLIRTDNGKIALNKNRQAYLCDTLKILYSTRNELNSHKSKPFTQRGLEIKKIFEDVLETECVSMEDDFFELGGSSLKTVVLLKTLSQNFDIEVNSDDLIEYSTIEGILELIDIKRGKKIDVEENQVAIDVYDDDYDAKLERRKKADGCINNYIRINDIEMVYGENKTSVNEIIEEFKKKGKDIETLVKEQLGKEILYLSDNDKENSLTLELKVIRKALNTSGLEGKDFDMIVSSVTVPEYTVPPMSLLIHHRINGKKDAVCYDVNVNCAGMITGMTEIYRRMEADSRINRVLLVGSEFSSVHMSPDDFKMRATLSDAACAVIIERSDIKCGLLDSKTYVNTKNIDGFAFPGCGFSKIYKSPVKDYYTKIGDSGWNTDKAGALIRNILKENYLKLEDVALICSTQLVGFNLKLLRKNLNIGEDKILYIGDKYGYTGTCAPFTVLYEGIKSGKVKRGDYVLLWTIGAGGYYIFTLIKY